MTENQLVQVLVAMLLTGSDDDDVFTQAAAFRALYGDWCHPPTLVSAAHCLIRNHREQIAAAIQATI